MNYRYERKFLIDSFSRLQIESIIKSHPAIFKEIYKPRIVNSIYLDTLNMQNVEDNLAGINNREKNRVRWYGETFGMVSLPILEVKIKRGLLGTKERFSLNSFTLDNNFSSDTINRVFQSSDLPDNKMFSLNLSTPTILDVYTRKYFLSSDKKFRLTLDFNIKYFKINQMFNSFLESVTTDNLVIEIKYAKEYDNEISQLTNFFPFRVTKNSKYVTGADYFYSVS